MAHILYIYNIQRLRHKPQKKISVFKGFQCCNNVSNITMVIRLTVCRFTEQITIMTPQVASQQIIPSSRTFSCSCFCLWQFVWLKINQSEQDAVSYVFGRLCYFLYSLRERSAFIKELNSYQLKHLLCDLLYQRFSSVFAAHFNSCYGTSLKHGTNSI